MPFLFFIFIRAAALLFSRMKFVPVIGVQVALSCNFPCLLRSVVAALRRGRCGVLCVLCVPCFINAF